ncbi:MAG: DUF2284 domain-containing protein [Nitrospinota bacterium]|nr:DUF2284 domain-containing protein [Nitrospinota bacterium]MDH5677305.1 DUF2284 domain-containing protein [Nitrospinota bacterium]MDH5755696.1 DUF2284 domain-containing protein [Nitrospinota bacterium]
MSNSKILEEYALERGASRARVFPARLVAIDERVRMKCQIPLCPHYGHCLTCPPNAPTVEEFRRALELYENAIMIQVKSPIAGEMDTAAKNEVLKYMAAPGAEWKKHKGKELSDEQQDLDNMRLAAIALHKIINEVEGKALTMGYPFATGLIGGECMLCVECVGVGSEKKCPRPYEARPSLEGVGIDVIKTSIRAEMGFEIPPKTEVTWSGLILLD